MPDESIIVIEDHYQTRHSLQKALKMRGFQAESAGQVAAARELIAQHRNETAVLVLDMRLEDSQFPSITGADLGIELLASPELTQRPEILIHSGYSEMSYYQLFLKLGAAAYLHKQDCSQDQLIRHIRALRLRRALSLDQPSTAAQIRKIAETSHTGAAAIESVCKNLLEGNFARYLGAPFIFLLTQGAITCCCGGDSGLPLDRHAIYETIQALVFAEVRSGEPFVIDSAMAPKSGSSQDRVILDRLHGAAFLPFRIANDLHLSIGIIQAGQTERLLPEHARELSGVLSQYFKSDILELLLHVIRIEHVGRQSGMFSATSRLCLSIGQSQLQALEEVATSNQELMKSPSFAHLKNSAKELRDTGKLLSALDDNDSTTKASSVDVATFTQAFCNDLEPPLAKAIAVEGNCTAAITEEDLLVIFSRILQWFAQRFIEVSEGTPPRITIRCAQTKTGAQIVFEDASRRLPAPLRERLFSPFTQKVDVSTVDKKLVGPGVSFPLYLAKILVEMKYQGSLNDRSDEIAATGGAKTNALVGHRFVIDLPSRK